MCLNERRIHDETVQHIKEYYFGGQSKRKFVEKYLINGVFFEIG